MKRLFKNIVWFFLPVLLLFIVAEIMISIKRHELVSEVNIGRVFSDIGCEYRWTKKMAANQALLMGSSTVKYGISCSILDSLSKDSLKFINLAADSRDPVASYFLLEKMALDKVKVVLFGLDPWMYSKAYYGHRFGVYYLDFTLPDAAKYFMEHDKKLFQRRYLFLMKYIFKYSPASCPQEDQEIPADFGSQKLFGKPLNFDEPVRKKFQINKYGWSDLQFEYFSKIAALCKSKGIRFYTFITPKRSDFCQSYKKECSGIHKEFMERITRQKPEALFFGSLDLYPQSQDSILFRDAYHLGADGQKIFTVRFYEMMESAAESKLDSSNSWFIEK